jgi:solute carrier family 25 carnitine/acylcarnitine transporter 20/29
MRGVRGLYSGLAPSLARAFVVSGSRFSAYEFALWALKQGKLNEGGR